MRTPSGRGSVSHSAWWPYETHRLVSAAAGSEEPTLGIYAHTMRRRDGEKERLHALVTGQSAPRLGTGAQSPPKQPDHDVIPDNAKTPPERGLHHHGRGWFRTTDLSRVKRGHPRLATPPESHSTSGFTATSVAFRVGRMCARPGFSPTSKQTQSVGFGRTLRTRMTWPSASELDAKPATRGTWSPALGARLLMRPGVFEPATAGSLRMAGRSLCARMRAGSPAAAGVRAVGHPGLEFAEVDVAAEEGFACVEQAGEDAGADQAEYGFAEAEADPRGGEEEAEQGGELSGGHVS